MCFAHFTKGGFVRARRLSVVPGCRTFLLNCFNLQLEDNITEYRQCCKESDSMDDVCE